MKERSRTASIVVKINEEQLFFSCISTSMIPEPVIRVDLRLASGV